MPEEIWLDIDPEGVITIETKGYTGLKCKADTRELEQALGAQVGDRKLKPEAHQQTAVQAGSRKP